VILLFYATQTILATGISYNSTLGATQFKVGGVVKREYKVTDNAMPGDTKILYNPTTNTVDLRVNNVLTKSFYKTTNLDIAVNSEIITATSITPNNQSKFVHTSDGYLHFITDISTGLYYYRSIDGGITWTETYVDDVYAGFPAVRQSILYTDSQNNIHTLWVADAKIIKYVKISNNSVGTITTTDLNANAIGGAIDRNDVIHLLYTSNSNTLSYVTVTDGSFGTPVSMGATTGRFPVVIPDNSGINLIWSSLSTGHNIYNRYYLNVSLGDLQTKSVTNPIASLMGVIDRNGIGYIVYNSYSGFGTNTISVNEFTITSGTMGSTNNIYSYTNRGTIFEKVYIVKNVTGLRVYIHSVDNGLTFTDSTNLTSWTTPATIDNVDNISAVPIGYNNNYSTYLKSGHAFIIPSSYVWGDYCTYYNLNGNWYKTSKIKVSGGKIQVWVDGTLSEEIS